MGWFDVTVGISAIAGALLPFWEKASEPFTKMVKARTFKKPTYVAPMLLMGVVGVFAAGQFLLHNPVWWFHFVVWVPCLWWIRAVFIEREEVDRRDQAARTTAQNIEERRKQLDQRRAELADLRTSIRSFIKGWWKIDPKVKEAVFESLSAEFIRLDATIPEEGRPELMGSVANSDSTALFLLADAEAVLSDFIEDTYQRQLAISKAATS